MNMRLLTTLLSLLCILGGTVAAIKFAQGYRPTSQGTLKATGLLAANSLPTGASIFVDGALKSATDTTLNLEPGSYDVSIRKDGYSPWQKKLQIEKELVIQTNAVLFPKAPSLSPLTFTPSTHVALSPDGTQLAYVTASASGTKKAGIFVFNLSDSPISFGRGTSQIATTTNSPLLQDALLVWSPELTQILVITSAHTYLLPTNTTTNLDTATEVFARRSAILSEWKSLHQKKKSTALALFPPEVIAFASQSAKNVRISPDTYRMVYTATQAGVLAANLHPSIPATNTQPQTRTLTAGDTYVYDRQEDRNFRILTGESAPTSPTASPRATSKTKKTGTKVVPVILTQKPSPQDELLGLDVLTFASTADSIQWYTDSRRLFFATETSIESIEYDGTNRTQLYTGPFAHDFFCIWPNGDKLVIRTNFAEKDPAAFTLYAVGIR